MNKNLFSTLLKCIICSFVCFQMTACKPTVPDEYIQPGKLEKILYDYHLAEEIIQQQGGDSLAMLTYKTYILNKYHVSSAEFDASLVYYTRHTELLHDVYNKLTDRMSNEAINQGSSVNELQQFGSNVSSADTTDIWKKRKIQILFPDASFNRYTYTVKADTSYHKGDRIILDFNSRFIYQDGTRNSMAVLAIKFQNDSVATQSLMISSSTHYHMQIEDSKKIGIKEIKGYFMLNDREGATTTLRMLLIKDIRLVRMHINNQQSDNSTEMETKEDTLKPINRPSSALKVGNRSPRRLVQPQGLTTPVEDRIDSRLRKSNIRQKYE